MNSRDLIRHPGPETQLRMVSARGDASELLLTIEADQILLDAVTQLMDATACESGLLVLDGADASSFDYVIPSYSKNNVHAAWYSDTHTCKAARLRNATAVVGRRSGSWWVHCHALWDTDDAVGMGHLLPDTVTLASDAKVTFYAFNGGYFDVALDTETAFPLFHVHGGQTNGNAFIAKINPHMDIHTALHELTTEAGFASARVFGIGSLIGARFVVGQPMDCPISEVLIAPDAAWNGVLKLPMHCIDTDSKLFHGEVIRGEAPTLVTFEVMVVEVQK